MNYKIDSVEMDGDVCTIRSTVTIPIDLKFIYMSMNFSVEITCNECSVKHVAGNHPANGCESGLISNILEL